MNENIWEMFVAFRGTSFTQKFLQKYYQQHGFEKSKLKSYRNSDAFIYYIEHGKRHYDLAHFAPLELQPLLLFYGMTQLLKACLLTADPDYPQTAAVLAHGVSTRKRKKQHYTFFDDVVRIQKHGLTVHISAQLFHLPPLEGKSFNMGQLLARIPDLNPLFSDIRGRAPFYPITFRDTHTIEIPSAILDDLHMTLSRFLNFLQEQTGHQLNTSQPQQEKETLCFTLEDKSLDLPVSHSGCFYLPRSREGYDKLPEILTHFLLLYNLSMICRYETEWWSELFHYGSGDDLPFIESFLRLTEKKGPLLIAQLLRELM